MSSNTKATMRGKWSNDPESIEAGTGITFADGSGDKRFSISLTRFGYLAKSVAGSANVALTQAEANNNVIEFTGALTGNIVVSTPAFVAGAEWTLFNNTTGAYTLTFKGPSGSGLAITQTKKVRVYDNGTDMIAATAEL